MADNEYVKVYRGQHGSYLNYPQGDNDKILGGLCYIFGWIVSLIILLGVKPLSPFLRFHAIQALGLHIVIVVSLIITYVLILFFIGFCLLPFVFALAIYQFVIGIIIFTGSDHRVPWLGNYVEENYI